MIAKNPMDKECSLDFYDVKRAVSCLKPHKNDGGSGLNSDHIINAGLFCGFSLQQAPIMRLLNTHCDVVFFDYCSRRCS